MVMILTDYDNFGDDESNQQEVNMTTERYDDGVINSDQSRIEP